jgi:hypothetical protein
LKRSSIISLQLVTFGFPRANAGQTPLRRALGV